MHDRKLFGVRRPIERVVTHSVRAVQFLLFSGGGIDEEQLMALHAEIAVTIESVPDVVQLSRWRAEPLLLPLFLGLLGEARVLFAKREGNGLAIRRPLEIADA